MNNVTEKYTNLMSHNVSFTTLLDSEPCAQKVVMNENSLVCCCMCTYELYRLYRRTP